jgi:hypothetical protein
VEGETHFVATIIFGQGIARLDDQALQSSPPLACTYLSYASFGQVFWWTDWRGPATARGVGAGDVPGVTLLPLLDPPLGA